MQMVSVAREDMLIFTYTLFFLKLTKHISSCLRSILLIIIIIMVLLLLFTIRPNTLIYYWLLLLSITSVCTA